MSRKNEMAPGTELLGRIRQIWESARTQAARSVNTSHVCANWLTGQQIVEAEQGGRSRAGYGKALLEEISRELTTEYGEGFSVSALRYMRLFYQSYPDLLPIHHALRDESFSQVFAGFSSGSAWQPGRLHSGLSWTHYRALLKVDRQEARSFYEIEAIRQGWSARQLERQIGSLLFDRLLKSRDKEGVLALANEGLQIERPVDAIKDPYVLDEKNQQIFASRYQLHLPTEEQLRAEIQREMERVVTTGEDTSVIRNFRITGTDGKTYNTSNDKEGQE